MNRDWSRVDPDGAVRNPRRLASPGCPSRQRGDFFNTTTSCGIIRPDAIGRDVNIPALTISYRIHSRVGAAATLEGRDLSYLLPMMPIKVLSLVPNDAADIRDASDASLAAVDALRFRIEPVSRS